MRHSLIREIQEDDPSYDPIPQALIRAKIPEPVFRFAEQFIFWDGHYGPFSTKDLLEEASIEERELTEETFALCDSRDKCLAVLRAVAEEIDDYTEIAFDIDEDGEEREYEECRTDSRDIVDDRFHYVREIYGSSILSL